MASFDHVKEVLNLAKTHLGDILSAFEFWDGTCSKLAFECHEPLQRAFSHLVSPSSAFMILIETQNYASGNEERVEAFLSLLMDPSRALCQDGLVAQTQGQVEAMWMLRECLPEVCTKKGYIWKYDVSLPTSMLYTLVEEMKKRLAKFNAIVVGYGHVGDGTSLIIQNISQCCRISSSSPRCTCIVGNLHLNVMAPSHDVSLEQTMEPFIYEWIQQHGGSISAEHGIGLMKAHALGYSKTPSIIATMTKLKTLLDPSLILNPYKVLYHVSL